MRFKINIKMRTIRYLIATFFFLAFAIYVFNLQRSYALMYDFLHHFVNYSDLFDGNSNCGIYYRNQSLLLRKLHFLLLSQTYYDYLITGENSLGLYKLLYFKFYVVKTSNILFFPFIWDFYKFISMFVYP